jgi:4-hydroxy-tetrahydrodipicolinate reductase
MQKQKGRSKMTKIMIQGVNGRMGHVLQELIAERKDCRIVAGIDRTPGEAREFPVYTKWEDVAVEADVLIDFSSPAAAPAAIRYCAEKNLPYVICTTGLSEEIEKEIVKLSKKVPVFKSANMSLGINLLIELCKKASRILGEDYDVEIIEKHHHSKVDAPSGTALMLADAVNEENDGRYHYVYDRQSVRAKRDSNEIGISSVRGGSIVGEHEVLFCGPDEVITLQHTAYSRSVFANGAVNAAIFLAKQKAGLYNMSNLLETR